MRLISIRYSVLCTTLTAVLLLMGCATPKRCVPLAESFWQNHTQKITVATYPAPTPTVYQLGAQGLLDIAITSIANKALNNALKHTDLIWYHELPEHFVNRLKGQHIQASIYEKKLPPDRKVHPGVLAETNGDLLLILELHAIGARRSYSAGFIPQGAPEAYCVLVGELLDPKNKKNVLWHSESEVIIKVDGAWDQPPGFPNFMNALNVAISEAREEIIDSFFCGR